MKEDNILAGKTFHRNTMICLLILGITGTLLVRVLFTKYQMFRVFELGWLCLLLGLLPAWYFRKPLGITNWLKWIAWSSALGLLIIPLSSFLLGFLRINVVFTHSVAFFYMISFFGLVVLSIQPSHMLEEAIYSERINWSDWVCLGIILLVTAALTILVFTSDFISYDFFTFWGLDARFIFEANRLRDINFDILSGFLYAPFYTSLLALVYDLYGKLAENYAVWINIFIVFVSLMLIWSKLSKLSSTRKIIITSLAGTLIVLHRLLLKVPSPYADTLTAFLVLVFGLVLINRTEDDRNQLPFRVFLILLPLVCLALVKQGLIVPTLVLGIAWIIFDLQLIIEALRKKTLISRIWLFPALLLVFPVIQILFVKSFQSNTGLFTTFEGLQTQRFSVISSFDYIDDLAAYLFRMEPSIVILLVLLALSAIWLFLRKERHLNFTMLTVICWLLTMFFFGGYVIWRIELGNQSLARYVLIIVFLLPLTLAYLPTDKLRPSPLLSYIFCVLALAFSLANIYRDIPGGLNPSLNPLSYAETGRFETEIQISQAVKALAGPNARILILDEAIGESTLLTNANESLYLRYFLMDESVGGQFTALPRQSYLQKALEANSDYLLLYGFDTVFWDCSELKQGHHYLVPVSPQLIAESNDCQVLAESAIDLDK